LIRKVFRQVVRIGVEAGVVLHAVEGTKIQARASTRRGKRWSRRELEEQEKAVGEWIRRIEAQVESRSKAEREELVGLQESLREGERLRARIRKAIEVLEEQEREAGNPSEPEARTMLCEGTSGRRTTRRWWWTGRAD
jgi:hypothetical protein